MGQSLQVEESTQNKGRVTLQATSVTNSEKDLIEFRLDSYESNNKSDNSNSFYNPDMSVVPEMSKSREITFRLFDFTFSLIMLIVLMPALTCVAFLIKIFSSGPVLYKQKRVGKNGKIFTLYKFRTMVENAEKNVGPVWASQNDSRVTPIGKVLRRTRLDELPQLFNVLCGNMSLVGPRPERPYFVERHQALQGTRLSVRPGLTGLAQIRSYYNLKPKHKVKYDYLYIQKRSLFLNFYILLQTIPVIFTKKGW